MGLNNILIIHENLRKDNYMFLPCQPLYVSHKVTQRDTKKRRQ